MSTNVVYNKSNKFDTYIKSRGKPRHYFYKTKTYRRPKTKRNMRILVMTVVATGAGMNYPMAHTVTFDTDAEAIGVDN